MLKKGLRVCGVLWRSIVSVEDIYGAATRMLGAGTLRSVGAVLSKEAWRCSLKTPEHWVHTVHLPLLHLSSHSLSRQLLWVYCCVCCTELIPLTVSDLYSSAGHWGSWYCCREYSSSDGTTGVDPKLRSFLTKLRPSVSPPPSKRSERATVSRYADSPSCIPLQLLIQYVT